MSVRGRLSGVVILAGAVIGCDPPPQVGAGQACNSLSECKPGLTCIEGVCDTDLTSIAGQVPVYADAGSGTGGDGGLINAGALSREAGSAAGFADSGASSATADAGAR